MGRKKIQLTEGDIFSIKLTDDAWTISQLCNLFTLGNYSQETLAFFDYKFDSEEKILEEIDKLDLKNPISIASTNGHPVRNYGLKLIANREVFYENAPSFKDDISKTMGLYRRSSIDFLIFLKPFFGIIPWDSYEESYLEEKFLDGVKKRDDIKFMKDYSIDELKKVLPSNNFKLIEFLKENEV
ncbi:MAG: hypothetical protein FWD48_04515 [Oscillospiraceae bacterium]|nr:hypothetical protein [Oscillospiraceae bacterium]